MSKINTRTARFVGIPIVGGFAFFATVVPLLLAIGVLNCRSTLSWPLKTTWNYLDYQFPI